jgi:hypothetical protein
MTWFLKKEMKHLLAKLYQRKSSKAEGNPLLAVMGRSRPSQGC